MPSGGNGAQGRSRMPKAPRSGGSRRRPSLTAPSTVALHRSTRFVHRTVQPITGHSFYGIHTGGLNQLFESKPYFESAGPFMRGFPSRAGPFMRISPSLSGTVYAWTSPTPPVSYPQDATVRDGRREAVKDATAVHVLRPARVGPGTRRPLCGARPRSASESRAAPALCQGSPHRIGASGHPKGYRSGGSNSSPGTSPMKG